MSRRKLEVNRKHLRYRELEKIYRECKDAVLQPKLLAILQVSDGLSATEVAKNLHKSDFYVRCCVHRYNENGLEGLKDTRGGKKPSYLSGEQKQQVKEALIKTPRECGFNKSNWTMPLLKKWINQQWGINYKACSLYDVVHGLGFSLQRPKKQSKNANKALQEQYKNDLQELLSNADDNTVILYEDEAIITSEPTTTGKWALKGEQPIVSTDSKGSRERVVMFGAVNPKDGKVHYSTYDAGNTDSFKDFLK